MALIGLRSIYSQLLHKIKMAEQKTEGQRELRYLVRIARTDIDGNQPIQNALLKVKGVGFSFANMVCAFAGVNKATKTGYLSDEQIAQLNDIIEHPLQHGAPVWMVNRRRDYDTNENKHLIGTDITFTQDNDIKRLKKIKAYKGIRHSHGQPVRGQRTRSNFRKNKGKVHLGVQRKKIAAPAPGEKPEEKKEKKK